MCKKTTPGSNSGNPVGGINPNVAGGGGGAPGAGSPFPTGPAPLVGSPDFLPQVTFIATPTSNDNGFIGNAETFHRNSGLNPISINSIQHAVELLNNSAQTGTGVLDHFRIVSHFFVDDELPGVAPSNIKIAMLNESGRGVLKHHLNGWAQSNYEGLKSMISLLVLSGGNLTLNPGVYGGPLTIIMGRLRPTHNALLDLVPTDPIDGEPTGLLNDFFRFAASKWLLTTFPTFLPTIRTELMGAYTLLLNDVKPRISQLTQANLTTLETAIIGLGDFGAVTNVGPSNLPYFTANMRAGVAAFNANFFAAITTMRQRFNQFSTVDIRGCQAGNDPDYIRAIRRFFGTSDTVRPSVTAPTRFQRFNSIGNVTGLDTRADIDSLWNSGITPFNASTLHTQFETWANGFGINQAHKDFWVATFGLPVLQFCKVAWKANIPARAAGLTISRLDGFANANFEQALALLDDIFFFATAEKPNTAQRNAIVAVLPNLDTWISQLGATIPDAATEPQMTTTFNNLKGIYENVDPRTANASFTSGRVIPRTAPSPLTVAQLRTWQTALRNFIDTDTHSIFAKILTMKSVGTAQANDAKFRIRYFLRLGLVFQLYHATSTNFNQQLIIAITDSSGTNRRQNEAVRHWIRSQWRGVNPPNIPATINWDNGRNTAWIVEGRQQGPAYVCPHESYDQHLFKLRATD